MTWLDIVRLGLVQAMLGAIVALTTSTLNRVMTIELGLPALLPGALVALHYFVQVLRPRFGFGSDLGGRRTPWIIGGMAILALGGVLAASAITLAAGDALLGVGLAVVAYVLVGLGVGAAGTALLALLARRVGPGRRGPAATIVWVMMIAGIAVTATIAGKLLDPFSFPRLLAVTACVGGLAVAVSVLATWRVEPPGRITVDSATPVPFGRALAQIWAEPAARRFTVFVFVSMLAYSAQELLIEPFAGRVFALTPGQSTALNGTQHAGVLAGMVLVALATGLLRKGPLGAVRTWTVAGCIGSAIGVLVLAAGGMVGSGWPLQSTIFLLGMANGTFAVSAIGAMMGLAHTGRDHRAGTRLGVWGAAQAVAFGCGALIGPGAADLSGLLRGASAPTYAAVFGLEAALFLLAAGLALGVFRPELPRPASDDAARNEPQMSPPMMAGT